MGWSTMCSARKNTSTLLIQLDLSTMQAVWIAVGDEDAKGVNLQVLALASAALLLRFAGADVGNAACATSSGLWLAKS
jgi:hypothetical protein